MELLIVIVNYRVPQLVVDCLRSLEAEIKLLPPGTRVAINDNCSGDDSVPVISSAIKENRWCKWATLVPLEINGGFAVGNNNAIRSALESATPPKFVMLLNPDTVVLPNAVTTLLKFMHDNPRVGIAGGGLQNRDGSMQRSAFCFPSILSELNHGIRLRLLHWLSRPWLGTNEISPIACPVDWVAGASMMIRREVFESIGLMDEEFFMYYEEVDFLLRANRAGFPCWYVPESRIIHLVGRSSGVMVLDSPKRLPAYWFDARKRYWLKNHGKFKKIIADLLWTTGFSCWLVRQSIKRKPVADPPRMLGDFVNYNFFGRRPST